MDRVVLHSDLNNFYASVECIGHPEWRNIPMAVAGDPEAAHRQGTDFLARLCRVSTPPADIVITTNGGYPLDQTVYQAVKGMTAAEAAVRPGFSGIRPF